MTKIECPTCGIQGHLQQRGNSYRIQHYLEHVNGKRKYKYHRITREYLESLEVNGSKHLEVNTVKLGLDKGTLLNQMRTVVFALYFQSDGNAPSRL